MISIYIENRIYRSIKTLALSFVLLLIFSSYSHMEAEEKKAPETPQQNSCVLLAGSQNAVWIRDATPNKKVAVLTGIIKDRDVLKSGDCAGTEIGLNPYRKIISLIMDDEGEKKSKIYIPPTVAKTGSMQMVDLASCRAGDIIEIKYVDAKPEDNCVYLFPEYDSPMIYSGPVSATGTVFHSEPFCASTLNISGDATVTVSNGSAEVVQNLKRVFGARGDGCYSGYTDSYQKIFYLDVDQFEGSSVIDGSLKGNDDSYTWKLTGEGQSLSGSFVNDHHYCCGNGNHTGTAEGNVTLSGQQKDK